MKINDAEMNKYDKTFFNKLYNKYHGDKNNDNLLTNEDNNLYNLIYEKYDIEISPITEEKYFPSFKLNSKFKSPKSKKEQLDFNFSNFISSAIFRSGNSDKKEGKNMKSITKIVII